MCRRMMAAESEARLLPSSFIPSGLDVLCGRDQESIVHDGNKRLRKIIHEILPAYQQAVTKKDKTLVVEKIVDRIRSQSLEGGFLRKDLVTGRWIEIGRLKAREKVGHMIRIELRKIRAAKKQLPQSNQLSSPNSEVKGATSVKAPSVVSSTPTDSRSCSPSLQRDNVEKLPSINTKMEEQKSLEASSSTEQVYSSVDDFFMSVQPMEEKDYFFIPQRLATLQTYPLASSIPSAASSHDHDIDDERLAPRLLPLPAHLTVRESQQQTTSSTANAALPEHLTIRESQEQQQRQSSPCSIAPLPEHLTILESQQLQQAPCPAPMMDSLDDIWTL